MLERSAARIAAAAARVAQHRAAAFDGDRAERVERRTRRPKSSTSADSRSLRSTAADRAACNRDRVRALALFEQRLHPRQRHEDRANRSLSRAQRKLAEVFPRQHLAHREPHAAADVLFSAVQRLGRDRRRILHAKDHRLAGAGRELGGKPFAQQRLVPLAAPSPARGHETARTDRRPHIPARATRGVRSPAPRRILRPRSAARPARTRSAAARERIPATRTTRSALPSRCSTRSRRLARTETPTISAPASTATAMATPPMTARLVRQ